MLPERKTRGAREQQENEDWSMSYDIDFNSTEHINGDGRSTKATEVESDVGDA